MGGDSIGLHVPKYKVVLLGNASVGKSSIVLRFTNDVFSDSIGTTIGAAFSTMTLDIDGRQAKFEIWDTAGQERFATLAPMYYRNAAAAVVVYDQTSVDSFERAQMWVTQLRVSGNPNVLIAMAANKSDLPRRAVDLNDARSYADENGIILVETSAKTGQNIRELFILLARRLPDVPLQTEGVPSAGAAVKLEGAVKPSSRYSSCCGGGD